MSCSKRPKPSKRTVEGSPGITFREAKVPPLAPEELRLRIRLLASALVDVWIEGGGLNELREEAQNAGSKRDR